MATKTAQDVLDRVVKQLQDDTNVRWTEAELLDYINDGQRDVVRLRPDASVSNIPIQLTVNETLQSIPATGERFIKLTRNMGSDGSTPGNAISVVEMDVLDQQNRGWHGDAGVTVVKHFCFLDEDPTKFYNFPRSHASTQVWVQALFSIAPTDVANAAAVIGVSDLYMGSLIDYCLFRAFNKDAEYAANQTKSDKHLSNFAEFLGMKRAMDTSINPNVTAPPRVRRAQ